MSPPVASPVAARTASAASAQSRAWIKARREDLKARYFKRPDPYRTLVGHATSVDQMLQKLWAESIDDPGIALVAVGGYGRGALFPHSDVDVLVLLPDGRAPDAAIERFIGLLWDSGLEPGHSLSLIHI